MPTHTVSNPAHVKTTIDFSFFTVVVYCVVTMHAMTTIVPTSNTQSTHMLYHVFPMDKEWTRETLDTLENLSHIVSQTSTAPQ